MGKMSFFKALGKAAGSFVPGVGLAVDAAESAVEARREAKRKKRERRMEALSAIAATITNPIALAVLILGALAFLFFAPPEAKASLMDLLKFFTE